MTQEEQQQALRLTQRMVQAFYCERHVDDVLSYLTEDITWIGAGEKQIKYSFAEIREHFKRGESHIPHCEISEESYQIAFAEESGCMIMGAFLLRTNESVGMLVETKRRVSIWVVRQDGVLKIRHMHVSAPYAEMEGEEYFPRNLGERNYAYLQRLLAEKSEVIEMIASNINGGLKGSNDDETYSYFYVNEGLPKMLGYTYEEFMEMSGGSAVGAVYPPDLPKALEDCEKCFAKGPVYSTEYRIRKKDGSLMWVLDSGRKALNSEGIVKINSLLMDITPLKQAQFDLEVERERYRIALQSISDVIFEYDNGTDTLTTFQRINLDGTVQLEETELPNFTQAIRKSDDFHPEDIEKLLCVRSGHMVDNLEIRIRDVQDPTRWHWMRVQGTVIQDSNHLPLRTIGALRDITEEKKKEQALLDQAQKDSLTHLLNQAAVRRLTERYLRHKKVGEGCALAVLDLDRFKGINDTKGHLVGNDVLVQIAEIFRTYMPENSLLGRIGGDEFLLVLKNVTLPLAKQKIQTVMQAVKNMGKERKLPISCSAGIVFLDEKNQSYDALFEAADQALYLAKKNGRNRLEVAEFLSK